jgi:hypothetical protein
VRNPGPTEKPQIVQSSWETVKLLNGGNLEQTRKLPIVRNFE